MPLLLETDYDSVDEFFAVAYRLGYVRALSDNTEELTILGRWAIFCYMKHNPNWNDLTGFQYLLFAYYKVDLGTAKTVLEII